MRNKMKKISVVAFIAVIGAVSLAFAHGGFGGNGYGGHMMGPGYGSHMMGPGGHMGWWGDHERFGLSPEKAEQLEHARESFYRESRDLRESIYDKSAEIRRELAKENPDRDRVNALQEALSNLESRFDQKRLEHQMKIREIAPEIGSRFGGGYGPGAGWCWR